MCLLRRTHLGWDKTGTIFIAQGQKGQATDWPGAVSSGKRSRARRVCARARLVVRPTMKSDVPVAEKDHHTASMATIARADRAYHDPAQFHLHEFGGGGT